MTVLPLVSPYVFDRFHEIQPLNTVEMLSPCMHFIIYESFITTQVVTLVNNYHINKLMHLEAIKMQST